MNVVHDRLKTEQWLERVPLEQLIADAELWLRDAPRIPDGPNKAAAIRAAALEHVTWSNRLINGPAEVSALESLRKQSPVASRGEAVAVDVCVWGLGSPAHPAGTKIGGSPFRRSDDAWPHDSEGRAMGLLAQFCFVDSLDVVPIPPGGLPGDVLLIFTSGPHYLHDWNSEEPGTFHFEWQSLERVGDKLDTQPRRVLDLTPCYASLHRTADYPESGVDDSWNVVQGTKLSGVPFFLQSDPEHEGRHLCTLSSVHPCSSRWPLLNVERKPSEYEDLDPKLLMIGDVGSAYVFINRHGEVSWAADCH
jgi:hypothetical protein